MKILLVVAYFYPEIGSASHLYLDLAKGFIKNGDEVEVLTSYPRIYNLTEKDKERKFPKFEEYKGIRIHRVTNFGIPRDSILFRGLEHFILPVIYSLRSLTFTKFDATIIYSPPLPLFFFGKFFKLFRKTPFILNVQDIYPQTVIDMGMMKNPFQIKVFELIEKTAYKKSDYITVHSAGNLEFIRKRGCNKLISCVLPNWTDIEKFNVYEEKESFREKNNLINKFLITYAGIMSKHQNLDIVVDAMKYLSGYEDIILYMIGDGVIKKDLVKIVEKNLLDNVRFLPFQNKESYNKILLESDVSIVTLDNRLKTPVVPGKIMNIMAAGVPILGNVPSDGDAAKIIEEAGAGIVVSSNDSEFFSEKIIEFYKNYNKKYGENGKKYVSENNSIQMAVKKLNKIIKNLN